MCSYLNILTQKLITVIISNLLSKKQAIFINFTSKYTTITLRGI